VRAAGKTAPDFLHFAQCDVHSQLTEPRDQRSITLAAAVLLRAKPGLKARARSGFKEVSHYVDGGSAVRLHPNVRPRAQFHAANKFQAQSSRHGSSFLISRESVVIGDGKRFQPLRYSLFDQFERRNRSVGSIRVCMQINQNAIGPIS